MSERDSAASSAKNIYQRMIEVQKKVVTVLKGETVEMTSERSYKAVSHDDVALLLHLPLAESGIVLLPNVTEFTTTDFDVTKQGNRGPYTQKWYRTDLKLNVKWINADKPEEFIESNGGAFALDTSDKGFAKAYSLALKIILLKVHLLESRDDEEKRTFEKDQEAQGKSQHKKNNDQPKPKPQAPPPKKQEPKNMAPADEQTLVKLNGLLEEKTVSHDDLVILVEHGFGVAKGVAIPKFVADQIISFLNQPNFSPTQVQEYADKLFKSRSEKSKVGSKPQVKDPADFVVTFGQKTTGKKIREIPESTLKEMITWVEGQFKMTPPPTGIAYLIEFNKNAKEFLKSVGVK